MPELKTLLLYTRCGHQQIAEISLSMVVAIGLLVFTSTKVSLNVRDHHIFIESGFFVFTLKFLNILDGSQTT